MAGTAAEKEPKNRAEWEAMMADETSLYEATVSGSEEAGKPADEDRAPGGVEEGAEPDEIAPDDSKTEPADEAQPDEDEAAGDEADEIDAGEDADTDDSEAAADGVAPPDESSTRDRAESPASQPLAFKVDGREVSVADAVVTKVPGASGDEEYIVIKRDAWNREIQPRLADRGAWQEKETEYKREIAARDPAVHADSVFARKLAAELEGKILAEDEDWDEKLLEWAISYREKGREELRAAAETEAGTAQADARSRVLHPAEAEAQIRDLETRLEGGLRSNFETLFSTDQSFAELDKERILADLVEDYGMGLFFRAREGQALADGTALTPGQWYTRDDLIEKRLQRELGRHSARRAEETKASGAEQRNEQRLKGGKKPAASVGGRSDPAPARGTTKAEGAKSRQEWEDALDEEFFGTK